jgi:hypothetical protein
MQQFAFLTIDPGHLQRLISEAVEAALGRANAVQRQSPSVPDEYLTRSEAAGLLRVSLVTLRNLERTGLLVPKRIGRRVLYSRRDVHASIANR